MNLCLVKNSNCNSYSLTIVDEYSSRNMYLFDDVSNSEIEIEIDVIFLSYAIIIISFLNNLVFTIEFTKVSTT